MSDNAGSCLRASRGLLSLRSEFTGQTVWFTGLPSAGKTSLSRRVETELLRRGLGCYVLDGDELRKDLNSDLDFSDKGRHENIRRFGHLARLMADSGLICLVSVISPFESDRLMVREIHRKWSLRFTEVFVDCPLKICMLRDVKGLYALAGRDSSRKVTGLSAPYEVPSNPEIVLETSKRSIEDCVKTVVDRICEAKSTEAAVAATTLEHPTNNNDLEIDQVDLQWVQVIAEKWASPLESFMDENDYLQSLHFRSIERNGKRYAQSVPIILPISSEDKTRLSKATGQTIRLVHCGKVYGMLEGASFFPFNKEEFCAKVFGLTDRWHPSIGRFMSRGDWLVGGGNLRLVEESIKWNDGLDQHRLSPRQLRDLYTHKKADCVFAFQLRNPLHNGHVLLIKETFKSLKNEGYSNPVLLLHPIGGWTKSDDVPLPTRIAQHLPILKEIEDRDGIQSILSIFPSPMIYAGPVEVQWHASARMNAGVSHYIVGRDPAGMCHLRTGDNLYDPTHGAKLLQMTPNLEKLKIIAFKVAAFNRVSRKMEMLDENKKEEYEFISGTKMRQMARDGVEPPQGFMNDDAWKVLSSYYKQQSDCGDHCATSKLTNC